MIIDSIKFRGHLCFKSDWVGFDEIKGINVIIGRNNAGKSRLLDLVNVLCENNLKKYDARYQFKGILDNDILDREFRGRNGYKSRLRGAQITWEKDNNGLLIDANITKPLDIFMNLSNEAENEIKLRLKSTVQNVQSSISGHKFRSLLADRDIVPEQESNKLRLLQKGEGATNIIRRHITSAHKIYPREIIQGEILLALNQIFSPDCIFTEINIKQHDESEIYKEREWEIFLGEAMKGLTPLSQSGSGLKTVLLVLLNMLVIPNIENTAKEKYVFAFEELENNLHPALLRRLYQYIESYVEKEKAIVFLTTHSNVAIDYFGSSPNSQIIRVTHDGETARTQTVKAHFDKLDVISELGAKASDLLQANGIIWVEGPSDRIYLNRWIELFSESKLREGRDYQCAFYGGALLGRNQVIAPDEERQKDDESCANLLQINPNIVVVCDGDRLAESEDGSLLKGRVMRIKSEIEKLPPDRVYLWITAAKEIENYLTGEIISKALGDPRESSAPDPGKGEKLFPSDDEKNYFYTHFNRKTIDKIELAKKAIGLMTKDNMAQRFDLKERVAEIIKRIENWNK